MIEMTITDLLVWGVGITIIMIGLLRLLSKLRREAVRKRHKKSILYCNVCVHYFPDESEGNHIDCPSQNVAHALKSCHQ